jgi:hypothetical protein
VGVRASASLWEKSAYLRQESDEFLAARLDLVGVEDEADARAGNADRADLVSL